MKKEERVLKMHLQCPMPKLDFDMITLGHGSGGLLTNKLLDSGVFDVLKNEILDKRHDGATLGLTGEYAFTTDSFVITPIFFPGGNIGELAVNGTVNDVAMCGAIPEYISLSFILEEGLKMDDFWKILISIKCACEDAGVKVVTGDTKVVDKGKGDQIFINTTGIGRLHPNSNIGVGNIKAGDKVILSDNMATHGVAIMSVRDGLEFETKIKSDTRNLNHVIKELMDLAGSDVHLLRDPTRGGVATVLTEVARDSQLGIDMKQNLLPIDEQVASACEILGLDPLYVANEGIFVAIVSSEVAEASVDLLSRHDICQNAAVIGDVVDDHPGKVILESSIGGKRVVNMLVGEQLPRIC